MLPVALPHLAGVRLWGGEFAAALGINSRKELRAALAPAVTS
jgi:hypothetical protein